jgi:hypothetical protein
MILGTAVHNCPTLVTAKSLGFVCVIMFGVVFYFVPPAAYDIMYAQKETTDMENCHYKIEFF